MSAAPRSEPEPERVVGALASWYGRVARDLPWRRTQDPYAIWVSEIMLQQTRVETAVPYFQRFVARYPDVQSLAAASEDAVLSSWQGLGYYRRARLLHLAARELVSHGGGVLPREVAALRQLPGIGRYTAGAIASIAYGKAAAVVDGNVERVLARLFAVEDDVKSPATRRRLWEIAERLVPEHEPGRFNQALMELGATVCLPSRAHCEDCPVAHLCLARRAGLQDELPRGKKRKPARRLELVAAVVKHDRTGRLLLAQRVREGLFGGLWEPPMQPGARLVDARAALARCSVAPSIELREAGSLEHLLTHRRLAITVTEGTAARAHPPSRRPAAPYERLAWCQPSEVALSTLARRVVSAAAEGKRG